MSAQRSSTLKGFPGPPPTTNPLPGPSAEPHTCWLNQQLYELMHAQSYGYCDNQIDACKELSTVPGTEQELSAVLLVGCFEY